MTTSPSLTFGELLKRYRVAAGLTQEELAERARVSPRTISDLERGVTNWPYRDTVGLLATALNLTAEDRAALDATRRRPSAQATTRAPDDATRRQASTALEGSNGAVAPVEPPSHLRTFLIADARIDAPITIEGSGAADVADAAMERLAAGLASLVATSVALHGGHVIEVRGNEAAAAFGSARQALRAALDLLDSASRATVADSTGVAWPLRLRIGLDAGEAVPTDRGYRDNALNVAARLRGLARPGEALATASVAYLARKTAGIAYLERGEIALEGLDEPIRAIRVLPEAREGAATDEGARPFDLTDAGSVSQVDQARRTIGLTYPDAQAAVADRPAWTMQTAAVAHRDNTPAIPAISAISAATAPATIPAPTATGAMGANRPAGPMEAHYKQVVKALVDGRVVPFLGPDANLCGRPDTLPWRHGEYLPTHRELAAYLADTFDQGGEDRAPELARASQYVTLMTGAGPLYTALHELYDADYPPTPAHHFFARLPAALRAAGLQPRYQLIVTTTYDDTLEQAFRAAGEPFDLLWYAATGEHGGLFLHQPPDDEERVIERPNEYRGLSLDRRTVILKLHGMVNRADAERDSYVVTEDNYINYLTRVDVSGLIPVTLLAKLRTSHVLFLGYGLRDWSQRVIMHRLWGERKLSDNYRSWTLLADAQSDAQSDARLIEQELWSRRDVAILPARLDDYIDALSERIRALMGAAGATGPEGATSAASAAGPDSGVRRAGHE